MAEPPQKPAPFVLHGQVKKPPPTPFQRFKSNPVLFLARWFHAHSPPLAPVPPLHPQIPIRIVCISDTHNSTPDIPDGDILLHAGDLTDKGTCQELQAQLTWLNSLPHPHKVAIAGNHDALLEDEFAAKSRVEGVQGLSKRDLDWGGITYLENSHISIKIRDQKIAIFGSPLIPQCGTFPFQYLPIRDVWKYRIPHHIDIVLTHGPPLGYMDQSKGCKWLRRELWRVKPRLVVFGHVHGGFGKEDVGWSVEERVVDRIENEDVGVFLKAQMVVEMVASWAGRWCSYAVTRRRRCAKSTFVNAAVAPGSGKMEASKAVVVEIGAVTE